MDPLAPYYLHQVGCGADNGIGPVYALPPFHQRGYGIGSFLGGLWQMVRPILWRVTKAVGREALCTGVKILIDIANEQFARRKSPGLRLETRAGFNTQLAGARSQT